MPASSTKRTETNLAWYRVAALDALADGVVMSVTAGTDPTPS
jgi:hypothetical protein